MVHALVSQRNEVFHNAEEDSPCEPGHMTGKALDAVSSLLWTETLRFG